MKFVTTLARDEDGVWIAECPSILGCVSQGETPDEALVNVRDAIVACLEVRAKRPPLFPQSMRLSKRYVRRLFLTSGIAILLLILNFHRHLGQSGSKGNYGLLMDGLFLLGIGYAFSEYFGEKVLYETRELTNLNGGHVVFPIEDQRFQLWIFCDTSFNDYRGTIKIVWSGGSHTISVPVESHRPIVARLFADWRPITWKSKGELGPAPGSGRIEFALSPAYPASKLDQAPASENIEVVVRTA